MKYLFDTHAWIWWNAQPDAISPAVKTLLANPEQHEGLLLAAISVWEFSQLLEQGQLTLTCAAEDWIDQALDMPGLKLAPLTPRIAFRATTLPGSPPADPIDQLIVATAREENATIITKDPVIADYQHVRILW